MYLRISELTILIAKSGTVCDICNFSVDDYVRETTPLKHVLNDSTWKRVFAYCSFRSTKAENTEWG